MPGVVCERCGTINREGLRFCENCDRFLGWDGTTIDPDPGPAVRARPPAPTPQPQPQPRPQPQPQPEPEPDPGREPPAVARPIRGPAGTGSSGPRHAAPERPEPTRPTGPRPTVHLLPVTALTSPTSTICANCGRENERTRRFCARCGEWLVEPGPAPTPAPAGFKDQFRRRWFGDRGPYSSGLTRSTVGFRMLVGALGLLVLTAILALADQHPIQRVKDQIGHIRGTGVVTGSDAVSQPAGDPPDPTAAFAVDRVRARGWSTRWTATTAGDPEAACRVSAPGPPGATGATATALEIVFPTPLDAREIGFEAGLVAPGERNDRWQPRTLELRWKNGGCQRVDLENTPDLQRFGVRRGQAGGVLITVVAGYPPVLPGGGRLDIGEVTVWQR